MKWQQFTIVARANRGPDQQVFAKQIRAVSCQHAINVAQRTYTHANGFNEHEATKCRCSEINNDMCEACYIFWGLQ